MLLQKTSTEINNISELFERILNKPADKAIKYYLQNCSYSEEEIEEKFYNYFENFNFNPEKLPTKFKGLFDKIEYLLKNICSKDDLRPAMKRVYSDKENNNLVATDAFIMYYTNEYKTELDETCFFYKDKLNNLIIEDKEEHKYPKYLDVIPCEDDLEYFFYLDITLMQKVIKLAKIAKVLNIEIPRVNINNITFNLYILSKLCQLILKENITFINFGYRSKSSACISVMSENTYLIMPIRHEENIDKTFKLI